MLHSTQVETVLLVVNKEIVISVIFTNPFIFVVAVVIIVVFVCTSYNHFKFFIIYFIFSFRQKILLKII